MARIVMRRKWRIGKRGTRSERMPRKSVTVCVGIRLLKATRKEVCKPIVPLIDVRLNTGQSGGLQSCDYSSIKGYLRPQHIPSGSV